MTTPISIIEKIRKLLALANGSTNANEAAVAAAMAQRLMDEHRIASVAIDVPEDRTKFQSDPLFGSAYTRRTPGWIRDLAAEVCQSQGCLSVMSPGMLAIVGRDSDAAVARHIFVYCRREIDRLAQREGKGRGARWSNSFRRGCVYAIAEKLRTDRRESQSGSTAMMVVRSRLAEAQSFANDVLGMKDARPLSPVSEETAWRDGVRTGRREIDIHKSISADVSPETRQIGSGS